MQAERIKQGCYGRVTPFPASWLLHLMLRSIPPHVPSSPRFPHTCLVHLLCLLPVILLPVGHLHLHMPTGTAQQKRLSSVSNPLLLTPPLLTLPMSIPSQIYSSQVLRFNPDCLWDRGDRCLCICALCHSYTHGHLQSPHCPLPCPATRLPQLFVQRRGCLAGLQRGVLQALPLQEALLCKWRGGRRARAGAR